MKLYPHWALLLSLFSFYPIHSHAQTHEYYVVVGAFAQENNAKKFTGFVKRKFYQSNYELNEKRNLYYVYAWKGTDRTEAITLVKTLQQQPEFFDCWVYSKLLPTISPVVEEKTPVEAEDPPTETPKETITEDSNTTLVSPPIDTTSATQQSILPADTLEKDLVAETMPRIVKGKLFKFDVKTPDGKALVAKIHHVNTKQGKDIAVYSSENYADVTPPVGSSKDMTLVCGIFGYKETTRIVNYANPSVKLKNVEQDSEGAWIIPFELQRLKSGDYSIMYDVTFFKNSVAMQEKSKSDLNVLLAMMNDNPRLKIRIHGHANGNKERAITNLKEGKDYFTPESTSSGKVSSIELSRLRALSVKNFLMDNGIEASRLDIKGVGGKGMIVSETHPASHLNDRIEIQILKD